LHVLRTSSCFSTLTTFRSIQIRFVQVSEKMCHSRVLETIQLLEPQSAFFSTFEGNVSNSLPQEPYSDSFRNKLYSMVEDIELERAKYCNSVPLNEAEFFAAQENNFEEELEDYEESVASLDVNTTETIEARLDGSSEDKRCQNCNTSLLFLPDIVKWNEACFCSLDCYASALLKSQQEPEQVECSFSPICNKTTDEK
jgi:hypothetical protein